MACISIVTLTASNTVNSEYILLDYGDTQRTINCIFQDSEGYIWFGTRDGLKKYNGYEFTHYRSNRKDSTSLSSFFVTSIAESEDGCLWIG